MATRLIQQGYSTIVYDVDRRKLDQLRRIGALVSRSPEECVSECSRILISLPGPSEVKQTLLGSGVIHSIKKGAVVVDTSTTDPETSRLLSRKIMEKASAYYLDAPVSGGHGKALTGSLTFMIGGNPRAFRTARSLISCLGSNINYIGQSGSGQVVKLINQILTFANLYTSLEALQLGRSNGVSNSLIYKTIVNSLGNSAVFENMLPLMFKGKEYGGKTSLLIKDIRLAKLMAGKHGSRSVVIDLLSKQSKLMAEEGFDKRDVLKDFPEFMKSLK